MSWGRLDDACTEHLKLRRAGTAGYALWTASIVWCSRHLTDGHIPADMLHDIWRPVGEPFDADAACSRLVELGLWDEVDGGWQVHDYLDYNMSRDEVMKRRQQAADRQRKRRTKDLPEELVTHDVTRDKQRDSHGTSRVSHTPPTRPDPTRPEHPSDAGEPRAPARVASDVPIGPSELAPKTRMRSSMLVTDPWDQTSCSTEELPWQQWRVTSRKQDIDPGAPTMRDRDACRTIEAHVLTQAQAVAAARGQSVEAACETLVEMGIERFATRYLETQADGYRGKRLQWRIGWVASMWAELTQGALPRAAE